MAGFIKGDIVVIPFPFSDLSGSKRRPAYVLADLPGDDIVLCQITSQHSQDNFAVILTRADFASGSLPVTSFVRPSRIFTADKNLIIRKTGSVTKEIKDKIVEKVMNIVK